MAFKVDFEASISFWEDKWPGGGSLPGQFPTLFAHSSDREARVADFLTLESRTAV